MWRATVAVALVAALAGTADARRRVTTPAEKLGKAFTAYEDGNLAGAASELKGVKPDQLANPDYFYWLRGQVQLLDGHPRDAADDFRAVAKVKGTRFAADAAWRLADCLWDAGDHASAAKEYKK